MFNNRKLLLGISLAGFKSESIQWGRSTQKQNGQQFQSVSSIAVLMFSRREAQDFACAEKPVPYIYALFNSNGDFASLGSYLTRVCTFSPSSRIRRLKDRPSRRSRGLGNPGGRVTIIPDLASSCQSQSHAEESEAGDEQISTDRAHNSATV